MYHSLLPVIGIVGILLLTASVPVVFNQQAMAAQGSIFEDPKAMHKWAKAADKGNLEKADKICERGGDTASNPGVCQTT